jgi:hypothetical protein
MINDERENINKLFDGFNECFARVAQKEFFVFEQKSGPNIGRALRFREDLLERGVFLELKDHWMKSDPVDPQVQLAYAARFRPKLVGFPVYLLSKVFYEGKLSGLNTSIDEKLKLAVSEVKSVSKEVIMREGKLFKDWPQDNQKRE